MSILLNILYENDTMLVVDKPAGISVMSEGEEKEGTLADLLKQQFPILQNVPRNGIVHRLDKDTSGVLLVAKSEERLYELQKLFSERKVQKTYTCLVTGVVTEPKGHIDAPLARSQQDRRKQRVYSSVEPKGKEAREAITEYQVLETFEHYTLLKVRPKTGRKHQIRAHLASLNHPIAGDKLYGFKNQPTPEGLQRQFLHASAISLEMPEGEMKEFHSELPEDLKIILEKLRKQHDNRN